MRALLKINADQVVSADQPGLADAFASGVPNVVEIEVDPFVPKLIGST
jgi:hypothetical protein